MNSMWPPNANEKLVAIIREHLLEEFGNHGMPSSNKSWWSRRRNKSVPRYYDPWWWPLDPGYALGDWGLLRSDSKPDEKLYDSLCDVNLGSEKYPGFRGGLGARKGCVVVLGERPSFSVDYGWFVSGLKKRLPLLEAPPELLRFLGANPVFHVTDLIKFRGANFEDQLTDTMIDISLRCLEAEFAELKPRIVLIARTNERPGRSGLDLLRKRLGTTSSRTDFITKAPIISIDVPHWSPRSSQAPDIWAKRVVEGLECAMDKGRAQDHPPV